MRRHAAHSPIFLILLSLSFHVYLHNCLHAQSKDFDELNKQIVELYRAGKYAKAIPIAQSYAEQVKTTLGDNHFKYATALNNLALIYQAQGHYGHVETLFRRALTVYEKALGKNHLSVGTSLNNLAGLYYVQGRYVKAEPLYKRVLTIFEKTLGPDHLDTGTSLNNLASLYKSQGRYALAEPLFKRALTIREKALGKDHAKVAVSLNNLAGLYFAQKRYAQAEQLFLRALAIDEKTLGADHVELGTSLVNLALLYQTLKLHLQAEPLLLRALAIFEKNLGKDHPKFGRSLNNLAGLYYAQGRYAQAERHYKRALAIAEKHFGPDHVEIGKSLNNLAELYSSQRRYSKAVPLYKRALVIAEKNLGPDHPDVGIGLTNLAGLYYGQGQWDWSLFYLNKGTQVFAHRSGRLGSAASAGGLKNAAQREALSFKVLIKAAYRLAKSRREIRADLARKTFQRLQWTAGAGASAGLSQMAVRFGAGNGRLAALVRERQDLERQWQTADERLVAAKSQSPVQRNEPLEYTLQSRLSKVDKRIAEIDEVFKDEFPNYAALTRPAPLSVEQVQEHLRDDEALIYFIDTPEWQNTPEESFIWVVTNTSVKWVHSELGTKALETMVNSLRCGLDAVGWQDEDREKDCNRLLKTNYSASSYAHGEPLPFDANLAHELYKRLFGKIENDITRRKLLLVLSGSMTSLPFQVMVTEKPKPGTDYGQLSWLIDRHQLTVLPSVASLKALRQTSRPSHATVPFLGIGNPLLLGKSGRDKRAWKKQICSFKEKLKPLKVAGYKAPESIATYFRGGQVDVDTLRAQPPLPETADELCAVAKMTGATPDAVKLGAHATEGHIKKLSAEGFLKQAKIIHFATHGLLAGETASLVKSKAEPALMLTPPVKATETDDGLLTASEVAQLKLDADWVILSACNTAGGEKPGAETMSGLAKAFFFAGARSLLVSHWYVNSDATVQLITRSFAALRREPKLGRAGALRMAMRDLIESKQYSHPEFWAPFIVVGEGR